MGSIGVLLIKVGKDSIKETKYLDHPRRIVKNFVREVVINDIMSDEQNNPCSVNFDWDIAKSVLPALESNGDKTCIFAAEDIVDADYGVIFEDLDFSNIEEYDEPDDELEEQLMGAIETDIIKDIKEIAGEEIANWAVVFTYNRRM